MCGSFTFREFRPLHWVQSSENQSDLVTAQSTNPGAPGFRCDSTLIGWPNLSQIDPKCRKVCKYKNKDVSVKVLIHPARRSPNFLNKVYPKGQCPDLAIGHSILGYRGVNRKGRITLSLFHKIPSLFSSQMKSTRMSEWLRRSTYDPMGI